MQILVTGASGFIGSHIMEYLEKEGHTVTGCGRSQKKAYRRYIMCDLTEKQPDLEADVVIHAAGLNPSADNTFYDYIRNNITVTENIIQYARKYQVKRIIYLGTLSSYGKVNQVLREDSPHNDSDDYGLTKYVAEKLIRESGIPYYIILPPTVIGKGCGSNWLMRTAEALYLNQDVKYYNGKHAFNNLVDVEDICVFISKLLEQGSGLSETYLLGLREMTTVKDIVLSLKERLSSDSRLYSSNAVKNPFHIDISKALKDGFSPGTVAEILEKVCEEVKNKS